MLGNVLNLYARLFARPSLSKFNRLILMLGLRGLGVQNYGTPWLSGEWFVLRRLLPTIDVADAIVIDVGANVGDFSRQVLDTTSNLHVLAFEPHPLTFSRLEERMARNAVAGRTTLYNVAVGAEPGSINLFDYADDAGSEHASVFEAVITRTHSGTAERRQVEMVSLDSIDVRESVRLFKIDVEGFELSVLQGASGLIARQRPDYVILEFNEMNTHSRTFFADILAALPGYHPYRILPGGKLLPLNRPYRAWTHELFGYQNLVFSTMPLD